MTDALVAEVLNGERLWDCDAVTQIPYNYVINFKGLEL